MPKAHKLPKKHHYVTQAQLRHFAHDARRKRIHVFDKSNGKAFASSIQDAGSENDFNTIVDANGTHNFEAMFDEVDGAGAAIVSAIVERRSLARLSAEQITALADLGAVQLLRTKLARNTPGVMAEEMRQALAKFGADLDDPAYAPPTEADAKRGTIRSFRGREGYRNSFLRLMPGLIEPAGSARFVTSDHPIVFSNPYPYGDHSLGSQGILVYLPLSPTLLLAWHCPTMVRKFEHLACSEGDDHPGLRAYGRALLSGEPAPVSDEEAQIYNQLQFAQSHRFLFSHANDFEWARERLASDPNAGPRESLMHLGKMGEGPGPRPGMPPGWNLVVHGPVDHCLLHLDAIDDEGEGITARTSDQELLDATAQEPRLDNVQLFDGPQQMRHVGQVKLEKLTERGPGWFRAVHYDESLRAFDRQLRADDHKAGDRP